MANTFWIGPVSGSSVSGILSYKDASGTFQNGVTPSATQIQNALLGLSNWALANYIGAPLTPQIVSGSISCVPDPLGIWLNSSPGAGSPVDENHLPAGFNMTSAVFNAGVPAPATTNITTATYAGITANPIAPITYPPASVTLGAIMTSPFRVNWTVNDPPNGAILMSSFRITGNYNIVSFSWTLSNLTRPSLVNQAMPGDILQISSPGSNPDLTKVTKIDVGPYSLNPPYCTQTPTVLNFIVPCPDGSTPVPCPGSPTTLIPCLVAVQSWCCSSGAPPKPAPVSVYVPTLFSGSVLLGPLTILTPNCTGVYSIVPGQTHDVLLPAGSTSTVSNPIPNPFFKTGYLGG